MISSIMANSILCSTFMLGIENEIGKRRTRFTMIVYLGYLICNFVYPTLLMRIVELNWRGVFGFCVIITGVIELFFYFYTVESPRTLIMLNRNSDAVDSLRYIAQCNGVEKEFEEKIKSNEYKDIISSMKKDKEILYNKSDRGIKALFKSKKDFKCCMIFNCIWFTVHMSKNFLFEILFDLDLNFNFTSYVYLDIVMQIVGIILISFLIEVKFLGRNRTLYLTCFIFTFVYSLYNVFDSNDQKTEGIVANVVYYLAIFLSLLFSGCKCLLYTYSVESYPTNLLATAFGLNMISASVGNIIGTLLEAHCGEVGEWIFSGLILISGVMAMFLEETRDQSEEKITEGLSLVKADEFDEKRKTHVAKYNEAFSKLDFIKLPPDSKGNSFHLYLMRLNLEKLKCDRNQFAKELQNLGVGISMHFIPIFHFTYWKELYPDFTKENFPECVKKYLETISLPLWPDMTSEMTDYVINCVRSMGEKFHA